MMTEQELIATRNVVAGMGQDEKEATVDALQDAYILNSLEKRLREYGVLMEKIEDISKYAASIKRLL